MRSLVLSTLPTAVGLFASIAVPAQGSAFVNFESPLTHPLAVSASGQRLYAVNPADNRLAVFSLATPDRPVLLQEIEVGLEPVSVTPRTDDEVWVVNRLSDSISVVSVAQGLVVATIRAKDEPADVVFAGSPERAFVSVSGSREVRVFDPDRRALIATTAIFGEEPRALARSADGQRVWVAVHRSGNRTTIVSQDKAPPPPPPTNPRLPPAPQQGLLVDADDPQWQAAHGIKLPDWDVFEIDTASLAIHQRYGGVGTTLFNLAVQPQNGDLWVANTQARNLVRFEPALRGHIVDSRLTRLRFGERPSLAFFDLNPDIDYSVLPNPTALASALAQPTDIVFSADGATLWVAAFGTDRVAAVDSAGAVTGSIELGAPGATADPRRKRGPRGLALHPRAPRLYVYNRIAMTLAVVDTQTRTVLREMPLGYDPTPPDLAASRGFLYDAKLSGNGTASCAACHIDGDLDGIGWDLGDPGGQMQNVQLQAIHPMKGPMTTQTLFGLGDNVAPFHWRGDRARLQDFNPAFDTLMGGSPLSTADIDAYAAFLKTLTFAPNPHQELDRSFATVPADASAQGGFTFFTTAPIFTGGLTCAVICHGLPTGTNGRVIPGVVLLEPQPFKSAHLRNVYKRVGRAPIDGLSMSGFGLTHDGSVNTVFEQLSRPMFQALATQTINKQMLERFVLSFDTGMAPAVGYAVTVTPAHSGGADIGKDLELLVQQTRAGNCEIVAKGAFRGARHGFHSADGTTFRADAAGLGTFALEQLLADIRSGRAWLTFTGVPPGSGTRIGIDRDLDTVLDADEAAAPYGVASPTCAGPRTLTANSPPYRGNALFALVVESAPASVPGWVLLSPAPASLPLLGLTLLVDPASALVVPLLVDPSGVGVVELPVPGQAVPGSTVYAQAVIPAGCGPLGLSLSNGLRVVIGS